MRIAQDIIESFRSDPEVYFFMKCFDEKPGAKLLEVGSHDSPIASTLANAGFSVTGVDLYHSDQANNYTHMAVNFCSMPVGYLKEHIGTFDIVIAISSIEHFGLNTYSEGITSPFYDIIAMRYIYDFLKPGGVCYLLVPCGGQFVELAPHWRVYDPVAFRTRLKQDFLTDATYMAVSEKFSIGDKVFNIGDTITLEEIAMNTSGFPGISCLTKLRKPG